MDPRRQRWVILLALLGLSYLLYKSFYTRGISSKKAASDWSNLPAANSTLGFGAVVAVSRESSPRRESLLLASNITEIDITIPSQPTWTEDDVNRLRAEHDSVITRGSALAWLGHLNALRWFLSTNLETVLILEDDVDWDIHLRTKQIPIVAAAVRKLVSTQTDPPMRTDYRPELNNYYGGSASWDILYLGHCGDIFKPSKWNWRIPRETFPDPTLPKRIEMHPYTQKFLESLEVPEDYRMVHQSIFPLCTFGFALTRAAARRLLEDVAAREPDGGTPAYDVRVLEACRDLGFRCWSANPELFHHMDSESEIANVNANKQEDKPRVGADEHGRLRGLRAGKAPNIACGTRSKNFFTRDPKTLEYLREVVGRQGKCLRDSVAEDMGKAPQ